MAGRAHASIHALAPVQQPANPCRHRRGRARVSAARSTVAYTRVRRRTAVGSLLIRLRFTHTHGAGDVRPRRVLRPACASQRTRDRVERGVFVSRPRTPSAAADDRPRDSDDRRPPFRPDSRARAVTSVARTPVPPDRVASPIRSSVFFRHPVVVVVVVTPASGNAPPRARRA